MFRFLNSPWIKAETGLSFTNFVNSFTGFPRDALTFSTLLSALEVKFKYSSHWFLDIMPKMSKLAGYELGSGVFINSLTPEDAAEQLRNAL